MKLINKDKQLLLVCVVLSGIAVTLLWAQDQTSTPDGCCSKETVQAQTCCTSPEACPSKACCAAHNSCQTMACSTADPKCNAKTGRANSEKCNVKACGAPDQSACPFMAVFKAVDLSAEQEEKISTIAEKAFQEAFAVLTPEQVAIIKTRAEAKDCCGKCASRGDKTCDAKCQKTCDAGDTKACRSNDVKPCCQGQAGSADCTRSCCAGTCTTRSCTPGCTNPCRTVPQNDKNTL